MSHTIEIDLDGRTITLETGKMAKQANGAVVVRSGDSVVLVTACANEEPKPGAGVFPAHRRLPRIHLRRRAFPGRLHQARRTSLGERSPHQPPDRPADPPAVPRRLSPAKRRSSAWCCRRIRNAIPARWPSSAPAPRWPFPISRSSTCSAGVRVGMLDGKLIANPTYAESQANPTLNIVVAGTEDGIVMVEAGARQVSEEDRCRSHRIRPRVLPKIAAGIRELMAKAGKTEARYTFRPPSTKSSTTRSRRQCRAESERRAQHRRSTASSKAIARWRNCARPLARIGRPRRAEDEADKLLRRAEGANLPRRDAEGTPPSRRPRLRRDPPHRHRSRRAAAHARFGAVHPRRDAGAGHRHAGHQGRRAAHRTARCQPRPASASCCTTTSRRSASAKSASCAAPGRREIGHGALAERALSAVIPDEHDFPLHHARGQRHPGIERFQFHGHRLRRHAGADGRRRADQRRRWPASPWAW